MCYTFKFTFSLFIFLFLGCNSTNENFAYKQKELQLLDLGKHISMQTKAALGKKLIEEIETNGTESAISFCSTKALFLTDSMSLDLNARIRRVSDKNRNPLNIANAQEQEYIQAARLKITNGEIIQPLLSFSDNKAIGYYPIMTNQLCLQCHGQLDSDISSATYELVENLYPDDRAVGYKLNELRGIWVVEMDTSIARIKI
jgi:hypothetical protein